MSDTSDSSALYAAGDTFTKTRVLAFPPRLSCSNIVSLLFLQTARQEVSRRRQLAVLARTTTGSKAGGTLC